MFCFLLPAFQGIYFSEDLRLHGLLNYFWILSSLSLGIFQPPPRSKEYYNLYNSIALHKYHWGVTAHIVMLIPCKWQEILMAITVRKFSVCLGKPQHESSHTSSAHYFKMQPWKVICPLQHTCASETGLILCIQFDVCRDFLSCGCCHPCQLSSRSCYGQCNPNIPGISCQWLGNNTEWKEKGTGGIHSHPFVGPRAASSETKIGHAWMGDFSSPSTQASSCKDDSKPEETHGKDFCGHTGNGM